MQTTTTGSLTVAQRVTLPTPPFFQKLRTIGMVLAAVSGTLAAIPFALPVVITQIAGYVAVAGAVLTAVSQITVDEQRLQAGTDD